MLIDRTAARDVQFPTSAMGCGTDLFVSNGKGGFGDGRLFGNGTGTGKSAGDVGESDGEGSSTAPDSYGASLVFAAILGEQSLLTAVMEAAIFGEPP